jgi:hypothetical protein
MPIPTVNEARDEILDHFTALWNAQTPPVPALLYDDKVKGVPEDAPFVRITIRHTPAGGQVSVGGEVGNRRFRRFGVITVQIFTITGGGLSDADSFATIARDAFEGQSTGPDRIYFRNVNVVEIGESGVWFQTNVVVDFDYDSVK